MPRSKRKKTPYNPAKDELPRVHDRRATDLLRNALVAPAEVDDPMGLEPGDKIVTLRNIRNDPLGRLHAHRQIDDAQYHGGRDFQKDWECAERGPQAVDPTKEYVDGGKFPEPFTDGMREAVVRLNRADRTLGQNGCAIVHAVLIHGQTIEEVCRARELTATLEIKVMGHE